MNRANVCGEPCVYLSVCSYRLTTRSKILHPATYRASCDLAPGFTRSCPNCPSLRSGGLSLSWSLIWLVLDLLSAVIADLLRAVSGGSTGRLGRETDDLSSSRLEPYFRTMLHDKHLPRILPLSLSLCFSRTGNLSGNSSSSSCSHACSHKRCGFSSAMLRI